MNKKGKFCLLLLVVTIALSLWGIITYRQTSSQTREAAMATLEPWPYSVEEAKKFWLERLEPLIRGQLIRGTWKYPEINERCLLLASKIYERHGPIAIATAIDLESERHPATEAFAASDLDNGIPTVYMLIPNLMGLHDDFKKEGMADWEQRFELEVVIVFMHELDHLAFDLSDGNLSRAATILREKEAWTLTCKHTMTPLVEKYGLSLPRSSQIIYDHWLKVGRDENSKNWHQFFEQVYGANFDQHRKRGK